MAYIAWATVATIVFALLFILQKNYSEDITEAVDQYNSTYGALLHKWLFIPLQVSHVRCVSVCHLHACMHPDFPSTHTPVFDVMFSSIVPLYDAFVWNIQILFNDVILDALIRNVPGIHAFGEALAGLCKHLAFETPPYITVMASPCNYAEDCDLCCEPGNN